MEPKAPPTNAETPGETATARTPVAKTPVLPEEFGGSRKPEPTRYGDWEVNGRCVDF